MMTDRKRLDPDALFTVDFLIEKLTASNATVYVSVSYGHRGGHRRSWLFDNVKDSWTLTKDDITGFWD